MGEATWTATEQDIERATKASISQAKAHGLDITDPNVIAFCKHNALNAATSAAESRFNTAVISRVTKAGHWAPGGCPYVHRPGKEK